MPSREGPKEALTVQDSASLCVRPTSGVELTHALGNLATELCSLRVGAGNTVVYPIVHYRGGSDTSGGASRDTSDPRA